MPYLKTREKNNTKMQGKGEASASVLTPRDPVNTVTRALGGMLVRAKCVLAAEFCCIVVSATERFDRRTCSRRRRIDALTLSRLRDEKSQAKCRVRKN